MQLVFVDIYQEIKTVKNFPNRSMNARNLSAYFLCGLNVQA